MPSLSDESSPVIVHSPFVLLLPQGLTKDVKQISSVDPVTYAKRFVKFMDDNMD